VAACKVQDAVFGLGLRPRKRVVAGNQGHVLALNVAEGRSGADVKRLLGQLQERSVGEGIGGDEPVPSSLVVVFYIRNMVGGGRRRRDSRVL